MTEKKKYMVIYGKTAVGRILTVHVHKVAVEGFANAKRIANKYYKQGYDVAVHPAPKRPRYKKLQPKKKKRKKK